MRRPAEHPHQQAENREHKKTYQKPKLTDLGSIAELTKTVSGDPTDGGGVGNEGSMI